MLTRNEKLEFIKSSGIPVPEVITFDVDEVYNLSLKRKLLMENGISCLGEIDSKDEECKECFFCESGDCEKLKTYIGYTKSEELRILITDKNSVRVTMGSFEGVLSQLNLRNGSNEHKVAKVLLECASNNRTFGDLMQEIGKVINSTDIKLQNLYFYKLRKKIRDRANINIEIVVQKYVSIIGNP